MLKKSTFKSKNSIGSSGEMVGGPMKKGQEPSPINGKKPTVKIDIMLSKSMPGIPMPGKGKKSGTKKGKC